MWGDVERLRLVVLITGVHRECCRLFLRSCLAVGSASPTLPAGIGWEMEGKKGGGVAKARGLV